MGEKALKKCKKIKSVTIGSNISKIEKYAFAGCNKLKSINIKSDKLKKIEKKSFTKIKGKVKVKAVKRKLAGYRKMLHKAGLNIV